MRIQKKIQKNKVITSIGCFFIFIVIFNVNIQYVDAGLFSWAGGTIGTVIITVLYGFVTVTAFLVMLASSLIGLTMTPAFMNILSADAIYSGWSVVRDFLNIFFIFFLLFSAFATIFQVQKYHIKSTWIMIVVMALLVNFSWPIARVMIDLSNVTMMYLLDNGTDNDAGENANMLTVGFSDTSQFARILVGQSKYSEGVEGLKVENVILGILVGAIFAMTMLAIAGILLIRIFALAVLLVMAPVGFVFAAFPSTKGYANQWWDAFTKQVFIGPILLFFMLLALKMLEGMKTTLESDINKMAAENSRGGDMLQTLMVYAITVIVMWAGIIAASKVGAGGASMALGAGKKALNGGMSKIKGGMKNTGAFVGREAGARTGVTAANRRMKDKFKSMGENTKNRQEKQIAGSKFTKKSERAGKLKNLENKAVLEAEKKAKENGVSSEDAADEVMKEMKKDEKDRNNVKMRANMNLAMKGDSFGKNEDQHAVFADAVKNNKSFSDSEKETLGGKIDKSFKEKGNRLTVMKNRISDGTFKDETEAYDKILANASGKDLGKDGRLLKQLATSNDTVDKNIKHMLQSRVSNNAALKQEITKHAGNDATNHARAMKLI